MASTTSMPIAILLLLVWNLSVIPYVFTQSNYASHANNIGYQGEGLPEEATLDGKVSTLILSAITKKRSLCFRI